MTAPPHAGWPARTHWNWNDGDWLDAAAQQAWRANDHAGFCACVVRLLEIRDPAGGRHVQRARAWIRALQDPLRDAGRALAATMASAINDVREVERPRDIAEAIVSAWARWTHTAHHGSALLWIVGLVPWRTRGTRLLFGVPAEDVWRVADSWSAAWSRAGWISLSGVGMTRYLESPVLRGTTARLNILYGGGAIVLACHVDAIPLPEVVGEIPRLPVVGIP